LLALEDVGDCDFPIAICACVAVGAAAPVPVKLPEEVWGRLSRTRPVNIAAMIKPHPVKARIIISFCDPLQRKDQPMD
jgi:hypothetical protein